MSKVKDKLLWLVILLAFPASYAMHLIKSSLGLDRKRKGSI